MSDLQNRRERGLSRNSQSLPPGLRVPILDCQILRCTPAPEVPICGTDSLDEKRWPRPLPKSRASLERRHNDWR
jgi:hypothetical protein